MNNKKKSKINYDNFHESMKNRNDSYLNVSEDWQEIKDFISSEIKDKKTKFLEIGSGGGFFSKWLKKQDYIVTSSDISKTARDQIKKQRYADNVISLDANKINLNEKYNVIVALDVIEHLKNVDSHLHEIGKSLTKEGLYIIKTPNKHLENLYYKHFLLRNDSKKKHPWWTAHISLVSYFEIKKKLIKAGFKKVKFIKQRKLTKAQEKKVKLLLPKFLSGLLISLINIALIILPKSLQVQYIVIAYK